MSQKIFSVDHINRLLWVTLMASDLQRTFWQKKWAWESKFWRKSKKGCWIDHNKLPPSPKRSPNLGQHSFKLPLLLMETGSTSFPKKQIQKNFQEFSEKILLEKVSKNSSKLVRYQGFGVKKWSSFRRRKITAFF